MNPDVQADIERRLKKLESTTVRYRAGEVSATGPLDVKLGGSDVPYEDVRSIEANLRVGDQVATLVFGNDLIVLGRVLTGNAWNAGSSSAIWTASVLSAPVVVAHGLGAVPRHKDAQTESQLFEFKITADATNLTITGYRTDNTAQSSTINFTWMAML